MEWTLHPLLSPGDPLRPNCWYVIPTEEGAQLGPRLGTAAAAVDAERVLFLGGANPNGTQGDAWLLDLPTLQWTLYTAAGDTPSQRYDHAAVRVGSEVHVLGGADESGSKDDHFVLDPASKQWKRAAPLPFSPRTMRSMAVVDSCIFLIGGGDVGDAPVLDTQLHMFDTVSKQWSSPSTHGPGPGAIQGHILLAWGKTLVLHGGMVGHHLLDELVFLDTATMTWSRPKCKGTAPSARSGHAAGILAGRYLVIHGGLGRSGEAMCALDDIHVLDLEKLTWTQPTMNVRPIAARLDHSFSVVKVADVGRTGSDASFTAGKASAKDGTSGKGADSAVEDVTAMFGAVLGGEKVDIGQQTQAEAVAVKSSAVAAAAASANPGTTRDTSDEQSKSVDGDQSMLEEALLIYGGVDLEGQLHDDVLLLTLSPPHKYIK